MADEPKMTPALLLKIAKRGLQMRAARYYVNQWLADQKRRLSKVPPRT